MNPSLRSKAVRLITFAIVLFIPFGIHAQLIGDTYEVAKKKKKATFLYLYSEAPGFAMNSDEGYTGVCFDIMTGFVDYLEKTENIAVEVKVRTNATDDFTYFLNAIKEAEGGVFGLSNTTITPERLKQYKFSSPYIVNSGMILTHESIPTLNNISEIESAFKDMTAVTVKGSTNEAALLKIKKEFYPDLTINYVHSFSEALETVLNDKSSFTNLDLTYYLSAKKNGHPIKRHPSGGNGAEQFGIIMPKSNDWAPLLNEFLSLYIPSEDYRKMLSKNLDPEALEFLNNALK